MQPATLHIHKASGRIPSMANAVELEERIHAALGTVAQLLFDDLAYLPVIERLEQDLILIQAQRSTIERARTYLPKHS